MIAGIITTPNRQEYIPSILDAIKDNCNEIHIFNDIDYTGHAYNIKRMYNFCLNRAKQDEPVLLMMDDISFTKDWYKKFLDIREQCNSDFYTLFTRRNAHLKAANNGYDYGVFLRGFYDHAVIIYNNSDLIKRVDDWFIDRGKNIMNEKRSKHYDVVLQEYLIDNNISWCVTIPTLIDHIGMNSTLGHNIGKSINFIP